MTMSDIAIRSVNLSKRYRIGQLRRQPTTLVEAVRTFVTSPFRNLSHLRRLARFDEDESADIVWALRDVSFDVGRGEVVGIIGRNGAGKSTLLKVLSRITTPTSGWAEIHGIVGSLLEVGTGFHPELTGRDNIYMNGAILGMTRKEIDLKFHDIMAFSDIGRFVDTPVKRYSSGMKVRLAFSVAAHFDPEILVVDEVLSVGDSAFQKKCLGKMGDVAKGGRTVLFVSHNMAAVTRLCSRTVLLEDGCVKMIGPSHQAVSAYLQQESGTTAEREWPAEKAPSGRVARLRAARVLDCRGRVSDVVDIREPVRIQMEYEILTPGYVLLPNLNLINEEGIEAFGAQDLDPKWRQRPRPPGRYTSTAWIPGNFLAEGTMFVHVNLNVQSPFILQFAEPNAVAFRVVDRSDGDAARGDWGGIMPGVVRPLLKWTTEVLDTAPPAGTKAEGSAGAL